MPNLNDDILEPGEFRIANKLKVMTVGRIQSAVRETGRAVVKILQRYVTSDGVEREIDVLVIATGFRTTDYLGQIDVVGREGTTLEEYWDDEPRAFLGITVPTFPNLFIGKIQP